MKKRREKHLIRHSQTSFRMTPSPTGEGYPLSRFATAPRGGSLINPLTLGVAKRNRER